MFLFCNATQCMRSCHPVTSHHPVELGLQALAEENAYSPSTAITASNDLSFVFDPRVLCLLPAFIKMWQANLLACKQCKISYSYLTDKME